MFSTETYRYPGHCIVYLQCAGGVVAFGSGSTELEARTHLLRVSAEVRDELSRWIERETEGLHG